MPDAVADQPVTEASAKAPAERNLVRLLLAVLALTACLSIGTPLLGLRVLFPTDILETIPPWSQDAPLGFHAANPVLRDPVSASMPMWSAFRKGVLSGHFPLWTSYPSGGVPLGTLPYNGLLSVLNLPYLLVPIWYAPALSKLLEMAVAAGFTFLFLRRAGLGKPASLIGGLIYMNSGFQVVWTTFPQSEVGALIPALFWAAEFAIDRRSPRAAIPLAIAAALILLQGFPALALFALLAVGVYVLVRLAASRGQLRPRIGKLLLIGGAFVLAFGIASIQFLPFAQEAHELDLTYREQTPSTHVPARSLVTLGIPDAFGSPVDGNYFGQRHFTRTGYGPATYHEIQSFLGATALVLIGFAVITRLGRRRRASEWLTRGTWPYLWVGSAFTAVLIYAGGPLLGALQTFSLFHLNYIGRLRALFLFFLSCLAAMGFQALIDERRQGERRPWLLVLLVVVVGCALAGFGLWRVWELAGEVHHRRYVAAHAILPVFALVLSVAGMALRKRVRPAGFPAVIWVVPILIAAESLAFVLPYWPRTSKAFFYPTTSAHAFLQRNLGGERMASGNNVLFPGTTTFYGLRSVTAHTFEQTSWGDLLKAANGGVLGRIVFPRLRPNPEVATSPILDRLSVRYFLASPGRVFGREVEVSPPAGTVSLRAGETLTEEIPYQMIRGLIAEIRAPFQGQDQHAELRAQLLDPSGAVLTEGSRPVSGVAAGRFVLPVAEWEGVRAGPVPSTVTVRITLLASGGEMLLAADQQGGPSLSLVVAQDDGLKLVFTDGVLVYQRASVLPRIRWASFATVMGDPAQRVRALADGVPSDTVVLDAAGPRASGLGASLRVPQGSGERLRVDVDARGGGYLVVADAIQSGWRAWVDGRPADLVPADHALGGVFVPAGRHEVTLRYQPGAWRLGEVVSGLSVLLLLALGLMGRAGRTRSG